MKHTIFIIAILMLAPVAAFADDHPMIGQIQASGATADDEYVELVNASDKNIDIGSWSIQYKSASGATFYKKNFVKGANMPANGKYIIAGSGYAGSYDMKHSSFSLSSAGGTVFLVSNQTLLSSASDSAIVDQKTYIASAQIPSTPPKTDQPPADNNQILTTPAPAVATPYTPPPTPSPLAVTINEFMPAPIDEDEWIELYNNTGYAVDLTSWTIADGTEKSFATLADLILPSQFKLIELTSSHLNNTGDLIILRDANKTIVDAAAYGDWKNDPMNAPVGADGVAVARIGDGRDTNMDNSDFSLTLTPTPNTTNQILEPDQNNQIPTTKIQKDSKSQQPNSTADIKWLADLLSKQSDEIAKLLKADNIIIINNLNIGTDINTKNQEPNSKQVSKTNNQNPTISATTTKTTTTKAAATKSANTASGMVIVPAGIIAKDICVVRDADRSVEVRLPPAPKQIPVAGDIVTATGTWSTAKTLTLPRLLVRTTPAFSIIDHDTPPEPLSITISKISEHIGELVSTEGTIVEKQSTKLRIADSGSESLVVKTKMEAAKGDRLSVAGLIVKSGEDVVLTPLSPMDIAIIKPPPPRPLSLGSRALPYGLAVLPAGALAGAAYIGRRIKKNEKLNVNH